MVFSWNVVPGQAWLFSPVYGMATAKAPLSSFPSGDGNAPHSSRGFHDHLEMSNSGSSISPGKKPPAELKLSTFARCPPYFQSLQSVGA